MKLHLHEYGGTVWHIKSNERFDEPCGKRNRVHHWQCCGVTVTVVKVST
jgi:hypothetical protein